MSRLIVPNGGLHDGGMQEPLGEKLHKNWRFQSEIQEFMTKVGNLHEQTKNEALINLQDSMR